VLFGANFDGVGGVVSERRHHSRRAARALASQGF
jgi:hypothetical protein